MLLLFMKHEIQRNLKPEPVLKRKVLLKPGTAGLEMEGSRLRLPEASQTPQGAASSASPSFAYRLEAYATLPRR